MKRRESRFDGCIWCYWSQVQENVFELFTLYIPKLPDSTQKRCFPKLH